MATMTKTKTETMVTITTWGVNNAVKQSGFQRNEKTVNNIQTDTACKIKMYIKTEQKIPFIGGRKVELFLKEESYSFTFSEK